MPLEFEFDVDANIVRTVAVGEVVLGQLSELHEAVLPDSRCPQPYRELWDGRKAELKVTPTGAKQIIDKMRHDPRFQGGRIAVIAGDRDFLYGMARLTETIVELARASFEMRVFREADEAEQWLLAPPAVQSESA